MRAAIAQHMFKNVPVGDITCSFGVAAFPEDGIEPHALICEADRQLFEAKRAGKNTLRATRSAAPADLTAPAAVAPASEVEPTPF